MVTMNQSVNNLQIVTANTQAPTRRQELEGKEYLVVPMVMLTVGVHNGSQGPLYYPADELAKYPVVWNYKPIVVYHPQLDGKPVSACEPEILNTCKVGVVMGARFENNKLKAEAWLDESKLKDVDERVLNAVQNNEPVEISTGLYTDNEFTEGVWNGEEYTAIARNYRPDHLAILPDAQGACSLADGAGLLRNKEGVVAKQTQTKNRTGNQEGFNKIRDMMYRKLENDNEFVFIEEIYPEFVIYEFDGTYYQRQYKIEDDEVKWEGQAIEVKKEIRYKDTDGNVLNQEGGLMTTQNNTKEELVRSVIENTSTQWAEDDKEFLEKQDEATLQKMMPVENDSADDNQDGADDADDNEGENTEDNKEGDVQNMTVEQYIANAPAGMREVLQSGYQRHLAERKRLIDTITANKANKFTTEQLNEMSIDNLNAVASLAKKGEANYAGQGGQGEPATNTETEEEPLTLPVLNFKNDS